MKFLKGILSLSAISIVVGTLVAIPFGFGVGTMTAVCISAVGSMCNYVFFSKPKSLTHNIEIQSKPFLNVETEEKQNQQATQVFEQLHNMDNKPTFKGDHKQYEDNSNNELGL